MATKTQKTIVVEMLKSLEQKIEEAKVLARAIASTTFEDSSEKLWESLDGDYNENEDMTAAMLWHICGAQDKMNALKKNNNHPIS
jgi:hypothetical protein